VDEKMIPLKRQLMRMKVVHPFEEFLSLNPLILLFRHAQSDFRGHVEPVETFEDSNWGKPGIKIKNTDTVKFR